MKSILQLLLVVSLLAYGGITLQAAEPAAKKKAAVDLAPAVPATEEKLVRFVWFPRFSPNGKWLLTAHGSWEGTEGGEVRMWDAAKGEVKHLLKQPRGIRSVAWSPDGSSFVIGGYGGDLQVFDTTTAKLLHQANLGTNIEGVAIDADATRLVATLGSGSIRVLELPSHKEVHIFKSAHKGGIWGMALSSNGKLLATAGRDTFVRIHDLTTLKKVYEFKHPGETNGVTFTPDDKRLLTGCTDGLIRVFDLDAGRPVGELKGHEPGSVTDLMFTSDGNLLASCGGDSTVRLWDTTDLTKPSLKQTFSDHKNIVFGVAFSPDNAALASVDWNDSVLVRNVAKGTELWSWKR